MSGSPVVMRKESVSPTKYSRIHEKRDLADLNNRLACYIDRVRTLEVENRRLASDTKAAEEQTQREVAAVKGLYESELGEARSLLDELSREKAKIQIDTQRLFSENEILRVDNEKKDTEINNLRVDLSLQEKLVSDLSSKYNSARSEKKKLDESNKALLLEKLKLSDELSKVRNQLEKEILARVDVENTLQTIKEEYIFNEQLLRQQLVDLRKSLDHQKTEIDSKLNQEYEERLCQSLQEIRDQYGMDLEDNKEQLRNSYLDKIKSLENQLTRNNNITTKTMEELKSMQNKINKLNKRIKDLELERSSLLNSLRECESKLDHVTAEHLEEYKQHEAEMKALREEMARKSEDYEELMDAKIALDMEISAFRALIEAEEARFNISPNASSHNSSRRILKGKRRHESPDVKSNCSLNSTTSGALSIVEVSKNGEYIKICNNSPEDISIGQWQLIQKVNDKSVVYKFSAEEELKSGAEMTVWSSAAGVDGDGDLVMEEQDWVAADEMSVSLVDSENRELAAAELRKHISFKRTPNTSISSQEKCIVM